MRKKQSGDSSSQKKGNGTPKTIDEYIATVAEPARSILTRMRAAIRSALPPEATETISYSMPAFKTKKVLVWFAAFKNHCSLFPTAAVIEVFKDELQRDCPFPHRQAATNGAHQEAGEGASRAKREQGPALSGFPADFSRASMMICRVERRSGNAILKAHAGLGEHSHEVRWNAIKPA